MTFTPSSLEGQETYFALVQNPPVLINTVIIGCDGGFQQTCTPTIKLLSNESSAVRGLPLTAAPGQAYVLDAQVVWPEITLRVLPPSPTSLPVVIQASFPSVSAPAILGMVVGRNAPPTCVSDFAVLSA